MTWLRVALVFLLGIGVGAVVRMRLPPAKPSLAPVSQRARARTPGARLASGTSSTVVTAVAPAPGEPSKERIYEILNSVGLKPRGDDPRYISWLYVGAPEAWLLKSQDYVESVIAGFEARADSEAGPFFTQLGLEPERTATLRRTLAEMAQARDEIEVLGAATDPPLTPQQVEALFTQSDEEYRRKIRSQLGPENFERFEKYYATLPVRKSLTPLFNEIAIAASPLTFSERDALVAAAVEQARGGDAAAYDQQIAPDKLAIVQRWRADRADRARLLSLLGKREFTEGPAETGKARGRLIYSRAPSLGGSR